MRRSRNILFFLFSAALLLGSVRAHGQYVWVSKDNNTHYVDVEFRINLSNPVLLTSEHQPALTYLSMVIDTYRDKIKQGEWKVWVESYVRQPNWTVAQNRAVAKVTSNVVKSYMIYAAGLSESDFTTKNYSGTLDRRQGITSVIIGARYPLERILPMQQIDWEASDLAWLTQTARTSPTVQVSVGIPTAAPAPGTDTIRIELPDFEALTFSYRFPNDPTWKKSSAEEATQNFLVDWRTAPTDPTMAAWGLSRSADTLSRGGSALENPLATVLYAGSGWGAATRISAQRNAEALAQIGSMIEANRSAIKAGESFIYIDSYVFGDSLAPSSARAQARMQSNTLKSYLIATYGVSEANFSTRNHSGLFDNQSELVVVTVASKQPSAYMEELQTIDAPSADASWRPGTAQARYRDQYAAREQAQMEYVNRMLTGLDQNVLTTPWAAAQMQDVAGFVGAAGAPASAGAAQAAGTKPKPQDQNVLPLGIPTVGTGAAAGIGALADPGTPRNVGVSSFGELGEMIAAQAPEKPSRRGRKAEASAAAAAGGALGVGLAAGAALPQAETAQPVRLGRGKRNEASAYVDADGKISIDATGIQRKMTEETQAQIAAENRAIREAEERALRESRAYDRQQRALIARKAKGRFAVFGVGINALSSAMLIPGAQIDVYFSDRFSAVVEGMYSKWNFSQTDKFNLEMISPELRYFPLGKIKQFSQFYIGVYGALGNYNLRWGGSLEGIQSRFWSAGLSAGYVLPLGKSPVYLDMGVAGGYVSESVDRYIYHQGDNYLLESYNNSSFFPVKARISVVVRIFNEPKTPRR